MLYLNCSTQLGAQIDLSSEPIRFIKWADPFIGKKDSDVSYDMDIFMESNHAYL